MNMPDEMIFRQLQQVVNSLVFMKRKSLFAFRGIQFFPSEIHLMLAVRDLRFSNATRMAEALEVTKGAVSQTISRLVKKGVLSKEKDPYNKNELTLEFTPLGEEALTFYMEMRHRLQADHEGILSQFTDAEKEAILRYLKHVAGFFGKVD